MDTGAKVGSMRRFVLLALVAFPVPAHAQALQAVGDTVRVGVLEAWPPYYVLDETGAPTGFAVESFEIIAARAGLDLVYSVYPTFPAVMEAMAAGEIDVVPNMGMVEGRGMLFTTPVSTFSIGFFTRSSTPGSPGPAQVDGPVGVVESNVGIQLADELLAGETVIRFGSLREALFRLIAGETDGLIYPAPVVWALARQGNLEDRIKETRTDLAEIRRAIAVAPEREDLLAPLNAVIGPFVVSEEYARLQDEWLSPPASFWTVQRVVGIALSVVLLILLAFTALRVAERTRMTNTLRQRELELRRLFESIRDAIVVADRDRRIVDMNPAAVDLFGYPLEEVRGQRTRVLYADDASFEALGEALASESAEGGVVLTLGYRTSDGRIFSGETTAYHQRDEDDRPERFIGLVRDVTERIEGERKAADLQRQLAQAQKLESIGRLAGGVAHDFNNMLTVIRGNVGLVLDSLAPDDPIRDDLVEVHAAAERSEQLTQQLLGFARRQTRRPEVLDPNLAIDRMLSMLRRMVRQEIELEWVPGDEPWPIRIDPSQLDQILANLVVNSRDAIRGTGRIVVRTRNVTAGSDALDRTPASLRGDYLMISVADDGCGIPPALLPSVFEPFVTTKGEGEGTGLGLATTYGIVQQNDGYIDIESEEGRGTTIRIFLPRHQGPAVPTAEIRLEVASDGKGESILLVDDDAAVLRVTLSILERLGYPTVGVQSPAEALRVVEDGRAPFDLLVTDVGMPGMNGRDLALKVRERAPTIPVLFISGYASEVLEEPQDEGSGFHLLEKPFSPVELGRKIREVLDD